MTLAPEILALRSTVAIDAELASTVLVAATPTAMAARDATIGIDFFMGCSPLGLQAGGGRQPFAAESDDALTAGLARRLVTGEGVQRPGVVSDLLAAGAHHEAELAGHTGPSGRISTCRERRRPVGGAGAAAAHDLAAALGQEVIEGAALRVGEDGAQLGVGRREHARGRGGTRSRCWRGSHHGGRWRCRRRRRCGRRAVESAWSAAGGQENGKSDDPRQSFRDWFASLNRVVSVAVSGCAGSG